VRPLEGLQKLEEQRLAQDAKRQELEHEIRKEELAFKREELEVRRMEAEAARASAQLAQAQHAQMMAVFTQRSAP